MDGWIDEVVCMKVDEQKEQKKMYERVFMVEVRV